jgi:hypothetical protein
MSKNQHFEQLPVNFRLFNDPGNETEEITEYIKLVSCKLLNTKSHKIYSFYKPISRIIKHELPESIR